MPATIDSIIESGLRSAGVPVAGAPEIARVKENWIPELVNDIVHRARITGVGYLKNFRVTAIAIGVVNRRRYALPSEFDDELNISVLDGDHTGTAQGGDRTEVTLESGEDISESDAEGAYVLMTSGQSIGQYRQIIDYDTSTLIATVESSWDTGKTPLSGDTYKIVDDQQAVDVEYIKVLDQMQTFHTAGRPLRASTERGDLVFDRPLDIAYGIRLRYFADPGRWETSDSRWADLAVRWQAALTIGVTAKRMEEADDKRAEKERDKFDAAVLGVIGREQPEGGTFTQFTLENY